jgi:hypothetical protein
MSRPGAVARSALFGLTVWLLTSSMAHADVTTLDGANAPIVRVSVAAGDVTIRTWDRPSVKIEGDPSLAIERRTAHVAASLPPTLIPPTQISTADGPVALAAESFVVSSLPPGPRDVISVKGDVTTPPGPLTVTVPNDAGLVFAHVGRGNLDVHDYRGGTFVGFVRSGRLALDGFRGDAFVQDVRGPVIVNDSSFNRLRARTAFGNLVFQRCDARQIEATSVSGSIVYDGGTFQPGLARFDSLHGNVAVGANGPVQFAGRAGAGRVYTSFDRGAQVEGREGQANAAVGAGGPMVTATSGSGDVYLYQGLLRARGGVGEEWRAPLETLARPAPSGRFARPAPFDQVERPLRTSLHEQTPHPRTIARPRDLPFTRATKPREWGKQR